MNMIDTHLRNIYDDLVELLEKEDYKPAHANSLFKGPWGALLFLFYYEQFEAPEEDKAAALLEKVYQRYTPEEDTNFSFCNGHTGPFWLLDHLNRHEFLDMDIDYIINDFIGETILQSKYHLDWKNYDFLHGSIGICHFLISWANRLDVQEHLEYFVNALWEIGRETPKGRSLPIFFSYEKTDAEYQDAFSLAHGSCAAMIVVAKIYQAGIAKEACEKLVHATIDFVLQHKLPVTDTSMTGMYPSILDGKYSSYNSRLAWCYGDLNVAWMLWYCGKTFGQEHWKNEALNIMRYSVRRDTNETAGVVDNCLCHGTSGIAAFYRKFWFETKEQLFLDTANHWYRKAVENISFDEQKAQHGIKVWLGKDKQWDYCWDLLDGGAGVGLAVLSLKHNTPLHWDECFLLS